MPIDTLLPQAPGPGRPVDKRMTTQEITGQVRGRQLAGRRRGGKAGRALPRLGAAAVLPLHGFQQCPLLQSPH